MSYPHKDFVQTETRAILSKDFEYDSSIGAYRRKQPTPEEKNPEPQIKKGFISKVKKFFKKYLV